MRAIVCLTFFLFLPGCFGGCSALREQEKTQCVDAKAPAGGYAMQIGTTEGGAEFGSIAGKTLKLDYGPQGGHHFYYSLRLFGVAHDTQFVARFYPDAYTGPRDAGGGGSGGGAGSSSSSTTSSSTSSGSTTSGSTASSTGSGGIDPPTHHCTDGGPPDCYEADTWFYDELYPQPTCTQSQWLEVDNQRFIVEARGPVHGTLHLEMGTCARSCPVDAEGNYVLGVVQASVDVPIDYVP